MAAGEAQYGDLAEPLRRQMRFMEPCRVSREGKLQQQEVRWTRFCSPGDRREK
jgi:hypothetical protein